MKTQTFGMIDLVLIYDSAHYPLFCSLCQTCQLVSFVTGWAAIGRSPHDTGKYPSCRIYKKWCEYLIRRASSSQHNARLLIKWFTSCARIMLRNSTSRSWSWTNVWSCTANARSTWFRLHSHLIRHTHTHTHTHTLLYLYFYASPLMLIFALFLVGTTAGRHSRGGTGRVAQGGFRLHMRIAFFFFSIFWIIIFLCEKLIIQIMYIHNLPLNNQY